MKKAKKVLALILSVVLLIPILPIVPINAESNINAKSTLNQIVASTDLGIEVGDEIAGYDFTSGEYTTVPNSFNNTTLPIESITVNSESKKALRIKSDSSPTVATHAIGTNNFAAIMSFTVDPSQTANGIFSFGISDKNKNKAAIWGIGLPKRTQTTPAAGNSMITDNSKYNYPSAGAFNYSTTENFIVEMVIFFYEGVFYAYWPDGTLVGSIAARDTVDLSGGVYLYLEANYGWSYIHELYIYELAKEKVISPLEKIAGTTGFIPGEELVNYDFNKLNSVPSSFIGQGQGIQSITVNGQTKSAFNVKSDSTPTTVLHPVSANNFAAVMTFTVDPNKTSAGTISFGISDKNKNKAAIWGIGLPKRTQTTPAAGNSMITDNSKYNYPETGAYEYSTTQNFTLQMIIYFYEGVFYAYWPDGTLVGSIAARNTVDLSGGNYLYLEAYYGWSYIHDLYICEITKGKIQTPLDKIAASMDLGIEVGDEIAGYDFTSGEYTTVPNSFNNTTLPIESITVNSKSKKALRIKSDSSPTIATHAIGTNNFAAVMSVTINPNQTSNGIFSFGVSDKNKTKAAIWGIGLPKRTQTTPAAGNSMITDNSKYNYPSSGAYEYSTTENFTLEMAIFFYEGTFYAYWLDGTFVGSIAARATVDLSGGPYLYLEANYGWAYIHDLYVYEIAEEVEEETAVVSLGGASVLTAEAEKNAGHQAMRFFATYSDTEDIVERGFILSAATENELTVDSKNVVKLTKKGPFNSCWSYKDGNITYSTYIVGFDKNDTRALTVRAYAITADGKIHYTEQVTHSVASVKDKLNSK